MSSGNPKKITEAEIDEELKNTFPASDAPSWTLGLEPDQTLMKAMRIHAYGGYEQLLYENAPLPAVDDDKVLVRVSAASVNPMDCKLASGALRPMINNKAVVLPWIPGEDFSGVVEEAGPKVKNVKKEDAVYGSVPAGGAYAQWVIARSDHIARKPNKLNFIEAASVPLAAQTAWQALFTHGHLRSGQTVLVHGAAGGVGTFAVQLAHGEGARVVAVGSREHQDYLMNLGVHRAIAYENTAFEKAVKDVDLVIDLVGGQAQEKSFKVIKPGGCLISAVSVPSEQLAKPYKVKAMMMTVKPSSALLDQLTELLDSGRLKPQVTKTYPLSRASEAWKEILSRHATGKIVITV